MQYPDDFPSEHQAAVEREKIRANQEFIEGRKRLNRMSPDIDVMALIRRYIIRVVLEFSRRACELGMSRVWTAPQIDDEVHEFMAQVTAEAHNEKRFDSSGHHISKMTLVNYSSGHVLPELLNSLKNTTEWATYQSELLKVSEFQSTLPSRDLIPIPAWMKSAPPAHNSGSTIKTNDKPVAAPTSLAEAMDETVARLNITHDELAHRIRLGKTTYYAVKGGRGKRSNRLKVQFYIEKVNKSEQPEQK